MRKVKKSKIQHELDKAVGNDSKHFSIKKTKTGWRVKHEQSGRSSMVFTVHSLKRTISWAIKVAPFGFLVWLFIHFMK